MELLPIIYYSLGIFAVLTVVTIVFSFISYKIKKSDEVPHEKSDDNDEIKHAKKFIGDKPTKYQTKISHGHSKKRTTKVHKESHRKKHYRKEDQQKEEKPNKPLRRIEVLNELNSPKVTPTNLPQKEFRRPLPKVTKEEKLNSLGDNILDKYADDLRDNLYTLDSDKKNKKTNGG